MPTSCPPWPVFFSYSAGSNALSRCRAGPGDPPTNLPAQPHPALFPKADQGRLVVPHDDPGIRAAEKRAAFRQIDLGLMNSSQLGREKARWIASLSDLRSKAEA